MTPKEKAKELVSKMNVIHYMKLRGKNKNSRGLPISMYDDQIKQCALIAVDEIIEQIKKIIDEAPNIHQSLGTNKKLCVDVLNPILKFWQEVKQEIKNYETNT